ncbi:MAG: ATP-binding cassette domain-containing protein [Syntrophobacteraceae bacterium]
MGNALVRMENIGKRFDGKIALDGAWLELHGPEILGVVGDNGAGKSTLLKVLAGVVVPDQGAIFVRGKPVTIRSPRESQVLGVEMVYQDFSLCASLTVWENAYLGRYLQSSLKSFKAPFLAKASMRKRVRDILQQLGIQLSNIDDPIRNLSGGQQQAVAISRSLLFQPEVLLLDEPTASMAVVEQEKILGVIRGFRERGTAVVMVTHNLTELFQVADRALVLKEGKTIWCGPLCGLAPGDLAHLMFVGRPGSPDRPEGSGQRRGSVGLPRNIT